jgi:Lon-like ATP-dependent protease
MLSRQTKTLISSVWRSSTIFNSAFIYQLDKLGNQGYQLNSKTVSPNIKFNFSTSNDDSKKSKKSKSQGEENSTAAQDNQNNSKSDQKVTFQSQENPNSDKIDPKRLKSVPFYKPLKLTLEPGEEKQKLETYVLFSSPVPIIPFSHQPGFVQTGNLGANDINKKLAFFIQNEGGEIYTVGLVLEKTVNKNLKKKLSPNSKTTETTTEEKSPQQTMITTKPKNYKVKLVEIEFRDNCIFAKGYPYKDNKVTAEEKQINISSTLAQIKGVIHAIKQAATHDKIDVFNNVTFNLDSPQFKNDEAKMYESLDQYLNQILGEMLKLTGYTKENINTFVQAYLEQKSIISRLFMVRKKLEETKGVLEIVNKSFQYADEQIWKFHEQAKARLSLDFIRTNYFSGEAPAGKPKQAQTTGGTGASSSQPGTEFYTGQAKKFMEKLDLIKDDISREKVKKEIERFASQDKNSPEYSKIFTYLDEVFSIPWEKYTQEYYDIDYSNKMLDQQLFGLEKVKERIIEMIAVNKLKKSNQGTAPEKKKGFVILLNGPPGTGKTTIAKAIASALRRESRFISFAGVTDPAFVKGHKRTYMDAQPGVFVKELIKAKTMNPVFILDEVDKLSKHMHGVDPYYALMEILNPEENQNFTDHYLDIKVDFSNVVFILTSNQVLNMLEPLRNRLEIIDVPAYIEEEKLTIAKKYLLPGVLAENGLSTNSITFDDNSITRIIKGWCYYESGVRELRRCFEKIARKHAVEIMDQYSLNQKNETSVVEDHVTSHTPHIIPTKVGVHIINPSTITADGLVLESANMSETRGMNFTPEQTSHESVAAEVNKVTEEIKAQESKNEAQNKQILQVRDSNKLNFSNLKDHDDELLKKYLGMPVFDDMYERKHKKVRPGVANVLTVSGFTGNVLSVECVYDLGVTDKKGQFTSSGNLQKVLQESLTIAKINACRFLGAEKAREVIDKNIHIHFLSGGVQKDGPSAGLSICSSLISLALNKPIAADISMTGELSLNGEACKIGGVQAKVTASKALDIKKIILPWGNKSDFYELPKLLKDGLTVYFVKEYQEVFNILFGDNPKDLENIEKFVGESSVKPTINTKKDIPYSQQM